MVTIATPDPASVESVAAWLCALATDTAVRRVSVLVNLVSSAAEGRDVFRRVVRRADHRPMVSARMAIDYGGALPLDPAVRRASLRGRPFVIADPQCAAAEALSDAAHTLCLRPCDHPPRGGLFWRSPVRAPGSARPDLLRHY